MANVGRPKQEVKRDKRVTVRFTEEEMKRLSAYAEKNSLKISETIQKSLELMYAKEDNYEGQCV